MKEAKKKYREKMETQFQQSDTRRLWQIMQTVPDDRRKPEATDHTDISTALYACFKPNPTITTNPPKSINGDPGM